MAEIFSVNFGSVEFACAFNNQSGFARVGIFQAVVVVEKVGNQIVEDAQLAEELLAHRKNHVHSVLLFSYHFAQLAQEKLEVIFVGVILKNLLELVENQ